MKYQIVISTGSIFEIIFYYSVKIYSLRTEQSLLDKQFVSSIKDTGFDWYGKCGDKNDGLKVIFHIKYKNDHIFNPYLATLDLNTDIVYANLSATPVITLSPMKEQKYSQARKNYTAWLEVTVLLVCVFILL